MAAPIGPGDWVECIHLDLLEARPLLTLGAIYSVLEVGIAPSDWTDAGEAYLKLSELDAGISSAGHAYFGFAAEFFRPIYRPNADFIESLKAPPKSAPRQPTLPTRTPEVASLKSRDEQNLPAHGVGAGV